MEPLPDLGSLSDERAEDSDRRARAAGARGQLPAPPAPRQDRHPARRARRAAAEVRRQERARPGRRRPADRDPDREGGAARHDGGRLLPASAASRTRSPRTTARGAARCSRTGEPSVETTQTFAPEDVGELAEHDDFGLEGPALVVRAGGGRAGESFRPTGARTRIGRSPDCEIFLDDVTVSRNHAVLVEQGRRVRRRGPGLAERHLRQPQAHRQRAAHTRATSCRSASTASRSSHDDRRRRPSSASGCSGSARSCAG